MSNQLTEIPNIASMPAVVEDKMNVLKGQIATLEMCRQLGSHYACTGMVPKQYQGKPEDAAVAIQWGIEIGLQPLQSLQNIACINGTPSLWGDALVALVKGSGLCEYLTTEWDEQTKTATVRTKRKGEPEEARSYSLEDAKSAGLAGRQTYQQHGRRMISARARSHVLRDVYADLLKGFQIREVAEEDEQNMNSSRFERDITPTETAIESKSTLSNIINAGKQAATEAVPEPTPAEETGELSGMAADFMAAIDECVSMAELEKVAPLISTAYTAGDLGEFDRQELSAAYKARKQQITQAEGQQ